MILDSEFLIRLFRRDPDAFEKGLELVERNEIQWVPAPVVSELIYGFEKATVDIDEQVLRGRLRPYPKVDINEEVAREAGARLADADAGLDAKRSRSPIGPNDAYIAASAAVLDDCVLTRNVDDFERLDVPVETF